MRRLSPDDADYVAQIVSLTLRQARRFRASDIHLTPHADSLVMQWRIDGVLHTVASFDRELGQRIVARTKVLAGLLTYRSDQPQEGRISDERGRPQSPGEETRVATFPTLYGERSAIRLFADTTVFRTIEDVGLPPETAQEVSAVLDETSGVVVFSGPSGSGKTTTACACLREMVRRHGSFRCLMTMEDPIEQAIDGATQTQVRPAAGLDLATGLKAMMRQDPDVIFVGEIRDASTAEQVFRAALTGHLVLTTFHAGSAAEAVVRLMELGIDPWLIRSTLRMLLCQRLVRRACDCRTTSNESENFSDCQNISAPAADLSGCADCGGTGYRGRFLLAERLPVSESWPTVECLQDTDVRTLHQTAAAHGMTTLADRARDAVQSGRTTREEIYRVLGKVLMPEPDSAAD